MAGKRRVYRIRRADAWRSDERRRARTGSPPTSRLPLISTEANIRAMNARHLVMILFTLLTWAGAAPAQEKTPLLDE